MSGAAPRLVLFDIDGTLVDVRGAGRRAFSDALASACAIEDALADVRFAGATDLGVLEQVKAKHGRAALDEPRFFQDMESALRRRVLEERSIAYPGVVELLAQLAGDPRVRTGLVTGNAAACAKVKLAAVGLDGYFEIGAYGDEHADRLHLACLAKERAERRFAETFERLFLIGDTPNDVAAARACGAVAIAVATGHYDAAALRATGADLVVETLAAEEVARAILPD